MRTFPKLRLLKTAKDISESLLIITIINLPLVCLGRRPLVIRGSPLSGLFCQYKLSFERIENLIYFDQNYV